MGCQSPASGYGGSLQPGPAAAAMSPGRAAARARCLATPPRRGRAGAWRSPRRLLSTGPWRRATRWWTAWRPSCGTSWASCGGRGARGRPSRSATTCTAAGRGRPCRKLPFLARSPLLPCSLFPSAAPSSPRPFLAPSLPAPQGRDPLPAAPGGSQLALLLPRFLHGTQPLLFLLRSPPYVSGKVGCGA